MQLYQFFLFLDDYVECYYNDKTFWSLTFSFVAGLFNAFLTLSVGLMKLIFKGKIFGLSTTPQGTTGLYVFGKRIDQVTPQEGV